MPPSGFRGGTFHCHFCELTVVGIMKLKAHMVVEHNKNVLCSDEDWMVKERTKSFQYEVPSDEKIEDSKARLGKKSLATLKKSTENQRDVTDLGLSRKSVNIKKRTKRMICQ